jgi:RHS repeat-associated protein
MVLAFFLSVLFLLTSAQAQSLPPTSSDDQMGEQAYQSYHGGDIDSVSLTSGTLSLNFPMLSYPQRGALHLSFNLMYNNQPQHQGQSCTAPPNPVCFWLWGYPTGGVLPIERGNVYVSWGQQTGLVGQFIPLPIMDGKIITSAIFYSNWSLQLADGSKHPLGNMGGVTTTTNGSWCGYSGYQTSDYVCNTANGPFETLDATAWRVNGALNPCLILHGCTYGSLPSGMTAVDSNGLIYGNGTVQDPNGNEISSNSTTITDSLGRPIPLPPTSQSSGNTSTSGCPVITGQPTVTTAVLWSPPIYNSGTQSYTFCYSSGYPQDLPSVNGSTCTSLGSVTRLQSIVLPNGQSWQFQYNDPDPNITCTGQSINFATLSQITLPTGGTISYTYNYAGSPTYSATLAHASVCQNYGRWVASRTVNANDGTGFHTWLYAYTGNSTVVTDPLGNDVVHTFGYPGGGQCQEYESQTQYYQGSHTSGTLLKTVNTTYSGASSANVLNGLIDVVPTTIQTVWPSNGQSTPTAQTTKSYDSGFSFLAWNGSQNTGIYGKVVKQQDYDYPSGTSLLRTTNTSYAWQTGSNYSSYLTNNFLNLPYSVEVQDGGGTRRAYTYYWYDESSLQSSGVTEQKVAGESYPGNQTSVHRWLNGSTTTSTNCNVAVTNGYLVSNKVYFDTGEVQKNTDPCTYPTTYAYSSTYYGAFPTTVTNALNQVTTYGYDLNTGAVTSIQDANLQTTTKNYDILTRPISVNYPDGGSTTACYSDTVGSACQTGPPYEVVVTKAITSSPVLNETSTIVFDGLGRVSQTQLNSDPSNPTYTLTTYDANGRKSQVYNPTRCSGITSNCGETTWGYTTTNYDALSRVTSVVEQDTSSVSTSYAAFPCTTVTDESGKSRESCVDGLGRMTGVWEDPSGVNYETDYTYDALGNLTYVNQKGNNTNPRTRTFTYDSLSEITSAVNPESGTILYAYDADGNLITKTAPLPNQTSTLTVTTTNAYDKLNRLTSKSYMDGSTSDPYTTTAHFGYDGVALSGCTITPPGDTDSYPIGRATAMCDGSGATSWIHDTMGRVKQERRAIGAQAINHYVDYTYNLDGSLASLTTPPMKLLSYTYNGAARPTKLVDLTDSINFVTSGVYAPPGELTGITLGSATGFAGFTTSNAYNDRLQPILLSATNSATSATVFSECFDFHLGVAVTAPSPCSFSAYATGDNGNVYSIVNNRTSTRTQSFAYDSLNRIASGQSSGTQWGETFTIDPWGNMTNETAISGKTNHEGLNTTANPNNQLAGFGYDAAGNMTSNGSVTYVYDAENRLVWTSGYRYIYDGKGQRVEKCAVASATTACPTSGTTGTLYWRGTGSDTLAETDLAGNDTEEYIFFNGQRIARRDVSSTGATIAVHYYFSDHLGSHGVIENATGTTCEQDIDYYPYGGVENDYCSGSGVTQNYKFTGKERDAESGLDNFGARYGASSIGRFMSADPKMIGRQRMRDPQQWNLYPYSRNSPTSYFDPDGREVQALDSGALKLIQQGLPANVRSSVVTDKSGFISGTSLSGVKSNDANFQALQHMVNAKGTVQVSTGATATDKSGKTVEFKYVSSDAVKGDLQSKGVTPTAGKDYSTNFSGITYGATESKSGNIEVHVSDATGTASTLPGEEQAVTMGHELYVHGERLLDGKPAEHEDSPNGEVNQETHEVEKRTRENAKQPDSK